MSPAATGVHFVGSFPHHSLTSASSVFQKAATLCPGRLHRIPDGELGDDRYNYVRFDSRYFAQTVQLFSNPQSNEKLDPSYVPKLEDIQDLPYDEWAAASYADFVKARDAGLIEAGVRFQVSIPCAIEGLALVHPAYRAEVAPLYEEKVLASVARLQQKIPPRDLAIQWDAAVLMLRIEVQRGRLADSPFWSPWVSDAFEQGVQVLARGSAAVHPEAELGFHLCYGDIDHQHAVEPESAELMVKFANGVVGAVERPIQWLHLPVPKDRTDAEYFAPLKDLKLKDDTELFLGLVHYDDLEGTRKRIAAAQTAWTKGFGVATECGMGRTPPEQLDGLLKIAAEVAEPYSK